MTVEVTLPWRRRDIARAAGALALLGVARSAFAQAPGRVWKIGYLGPPADVAPLALDAFRDGLRTLGYVDGRNIAIDYRWTTREGGQLLSPDELYGVAQELVARKVDVLAASVRPAILAARKATASVPIVMMNGTDLQVLDVRLASDLAAAFATMKTRLADGLIVTGDGLFLAQRARIAELATLQRLPTMVANTDVIEAGALLSYSSSNVENYRRAATFIDKILRGARPGDIPIEGPTNFELALNLKTAKIIGVVFPQSLLLRADRIVE